jgi:hypothetical protein
MNDHYYEYLKFCEKIVVSFLSKITNGDRDALKIGDCLLDIPLRKFLFMRLAFNNQLREEYNAMTNLGLDDEGIETYFTNILKKISQSNTKANSQPTAFYENYFMHKLKPFKNRIIYYALHERFLKFILPVLSEIP